MSSVELRSIVASLIVTAGLVPCPPPAAVGAAAGGRRDHRGSRTRLITWMTPLDAPTSAVVTRARLT